MEKNFFSSIRNIRALRSQTSSKVFLTADYADALIWKRFKTIRLIRVIRGQTSSQSCHER
jgi:hypothetical protein